MSTNKQLGCLTIYYQLNVGLQVGDATKTLVENYGARITCHDWYGNLRLLRQRLIAESKQAGLHYANATRTIEEEIDQADRDTGLRVGIAAPMEGGGFMIGEITAERLILCANCSLTES